MTVSDAVVAWVLVIILAVIFLICGFIIGFKDGADHACESVKLEWVQDKCMKVTREVV